MTLLQTPLEAHFFLNRTFYIKRDDLLHPDFSGNKARKFYYFLSHDFSHIQRIVSYGSNQSNAMYSLSVLAKMRGWEFLYFCDHVPHFLRQNPIGNYRYAIENGMRLMISQNRYHDAHQLEDDVTLVIEEGGRQKEAEIGIKNLALELCEDIDKQHLENPCVFLPSGTGTTALYLQKYLPYPVYTCTTVGSREYLEEQWNMVESSCEHPIILDSSKKYHYGKLYQEAYALWARLQHEMGVTFDLLYDPIGWIKLLENIEKIKGNVIYIHQGGLKGNLSMQARYERKYGKMNERITRKIDANIKN
ncbi:1-aminocyclopropane-1-carboxylate deaminase/D-cysteine desulfhydrase [Sulfurospirillum sp. 1612]|uniref:1-aminocyclopropane-1-carboxylate deaminase/D-cysteine desulfhydrase n=1 Tax=Sulfurospirillum sp. 1612 TaxID=3094835 RepID=UPI002F93DCAA